MSRKLRVTLDREELVTLLWSLEATIEDYKHDGGTVLCENEMDLHEKLGGWLNEYDLQGKRKVAA